jgi:transposase
MMALAFAPAKVSLNNQAARLEKQVYKRASWMFSGTVAGAKASAMIYSLMLTCRACNVEPYAYLVRVLSELPQRASDADVSDLLPFNFSKYGLTA